MLRRSALRAAVVAGAIVASSLSLSACGSSDDKASSGTTAAGSVECAYNASAGENAGGKTPGTPETKASNTGTVKVTLKTNQGDIPLVLDRAKAACTVSSFEHLVDKKFFDNTICHRLVETPGMGVLQCGDPTGTGSGGPGYKYKDELGPDTKYPAGTLAMANAGPDTNGSQFFMVTKDTQLQPDYTVFGTIDPAGMKVLAAITKNGITGGAPDGKPVKEVKITSATKG